MKNLKYFILSALILISAADIFGQLATRYPTNVRYIGGGYIDKRPQFSTLEAALNDVKAYATVNNPYVFWVSSDTIQIADWDSVFTESGLTMKDSIDVYYVAEGKIKWAGFGFGGGGGTGTAVIPTQTQTTAHYGYHNWDQDNSSLALWLRYLAQSIDSVDQHIWDLIVYTDSAYLYIDNDTLKFRTSALSAFGARPDTTLIVYKAGTQTINGNKTYSGESDFTGSMRIPNGNNKTSTSRILWAASNNLYWSHAGTAGDSGQVAMLNTSGTYAGQLRHSNSVGYQNLVSTLLDSIHYWIKQPHTFLEEASYTPNVTGAGTYVKWTPTFTETEKFRITVAGDSITIPTAADAGDYVVRVAFTLQNAAADDFTLQIRKNNVSIHSTRFTGAGASEYITVATWAYLDDLVAGDDISFYITNTVDADDPVMTGIVIYMDRQHEQYAY